VATAVKCDQCGQVVAVDEADGWLRLAVRNKADDDAFELDGPRLVDLCSRDCAGEYLDSQPAVK